MCSPPADTINSVVNDLTGIIANINSNVDEIYAILFNTTLNNTNEVKICETDMADYSIRNKLDLIVNKTIEINKNVLEIKSRL